MILGQKLPIHKKRDITRKSIALKDAKNHIRLTPEIEPENPSGSSPIVKIQFWLKSFE